MVLFAALIFVLGYILGNRQNVPLTSLLPTGSSQQSISFSRLDEVWELLQDRYVQESINQTEAVYGALQGMVASLKDPYTVFLTPGESESFQEEIEGTLKGIGAEIGIKENQLVVIAPLPGSPAERSGLAAGDRIIAIDGVESSTMTLAEAVGRIRGEEGTSVVILIQKLNETTTKELSIVREKITIQSVRWDTLDQNTVHLKISYFGPQTGREFANALSEVIARGTKGIILDLRSNPGGYLDAAVAVASAFLAEGQIVVIERFKDGHETEYPARQEIQAGDVPVVALVNQGTASGAEIVAGALQDHHRATIVGVKTFGKGSVQEFKEFSDGSSLKLTVAKWLTPNGRSINDLGVAPDEVVEVNQADLDAERDDQLERSQSILQEKMKAAGS